MIRFAQILKNQDGEWFLQIAEHADMRKINTEWQGDDRLGNECWSPDVDIEHSLVACESYEKAMMMLAEHYKKEIENNI